MIQKTSAPGSAEPQLRNACLSFWSVKAELGLRGPGSEGPVFLKIWYDTVSFSFMDDSKDLSTWERGAPAPQCLSELLERQSGAGAPQSRERRTSFLEDLVSEDSNSHQAPQKRPLQAYSGS